jgi:uncharacterized protein (TIGR02391 family)
VNEIEDVLHERIRTHCLRLYRDGHPKHAALEAMIQVEIALKERSGVRDKFGVALCDSLFGPSSGIKLRVPFGEEYQRRARELFAGAFGYYRNYAAHDGSKIDGRLAARILVIASELLDLIGASPVSFADLGVEGLVRKGLFKDRQDLVSFLRLLDGQTIADQVVDGFFEDLAARGKGQEHVQAVVETGLIEYRTNVFRSPGDPPFGDPEQPDEVSWFELTTIGKEMVDEASGVPPN